jgi:hypothetical protein
MNCTGKILACRMISATSSWTCRPSLPERSLIKFCTGSARGSASNPFILKSTHGNFKNVQSKRPTLDPQAQITISNPQPRLEVRRRSKRQGRLQKAEESKDCKRMISSQYERPISDHHRSSGCPSNPRAVSVPSRLPTRLCHSSL